MPNMLPSKVVIDSSNPLHPNSRKISHEDFPLVLPEDKVKGEGPDNTVGNTEAEEIGVTVIEVRKDKTGHESQNEKFQRGDMRARKNSGHNERTNGENGEKLFEIPRH